MNDTLITFHGWVGSQVRYRLAKGVSVASFRVAATPRIRKDGEWVDGETTWYSVTVWRTLAEHVLRSIRKGDPVIVHGRLRTETWVPENGVASTTLHVEASLVGHDLTRGMSHFYKPWRDPAGEGERAQSEQPSAGPDAAEATDPETPPEADADDLELAELQELERLESAELAAHSPA